MSSPTAREQIKRIAEASDPLGPNAHTTTQFLRKFPVFYTDEGGNRNIRQPGDMDVCETLPTVVVDRSEPVTATSTANYSAVHLYFSQEDISPVTSLPSMGSGEVDTSCATMRS